MTDVVYITGGKSFWHNNELRFSLRSLCKHLKNMGKVFVVGKLPDWCKESRVGFMHDSGTQYLHVSDGVIFIPAEDHILEKKEVRLYRKRMIACRDTRISDNALFIYDDEYLLEDHDADNFPPYCDGNLHTYFKRISKDGTHKNCCRNTITALSAMDYPLVMYDVHAPMLVNKQHFIDITTNFNWKEVKDGFLIKSTYANIEGVGAVQITDTKLNHPDSDMEDYAMMIGGKPVFSTGDNCNWVELTKLMNKLYPEPSPYEV